MKRLEMGAVLVVVLGLTAEAQSAVMAGMHLDSESHDAFEITDK